MNKKIAAATMLLALGIYSTSLWIKNETRQETEDEWTAGFNSAVRQFAPKDKIREMVIKKHAERKEKYTTMYEPEQDEGSYAKGYHKALEILTNETRCPRP